MRHCADNNVQQIYANFMQTNPFNTTAHTHTQRKGEREIGKREIQLSGDTFVTHATFEG